MDKLPFNVYDFFSYLTSGLILMFILSFAFWGSKGLEFLYATDLSTIGFLLVVCCSYILGHANAAISKLIFEKLLANQLLGDPTDLLIGLKKPNWFICIFFSEYSEPLPSNFKDTIVKRAKKDNIDVTKPRQFFKWAWADYKASKSDKSRTDNFLNLYGFARNMALALLIGVVIFYHGVLSIISGIISVIMFYRFLKFYRLYTHEVLVSIT